MSGMSGDLTRLRSFMDAAHLRQRAIAGNMANANTPGYQRVEVRFEEAFRAAMAEGEAPAPPRLEVDQTPGRPDGNNVMLENELIDLNDATLLYRSLAQAASVRAGILRSAITGH